MPCLRQISFTGCPASASFRIETICVSLNRDLLPVVSWFLLRGMSRLCGQHSSRLSGARHHCVSRRLRAHRGEHCIESVLLSLLLGLAALIWACLRLCPLASPAARAVLGDVDNKSGRNAHQSLKLESGKARSLPGRYVAAQRRCDWSAQN